MKIDVGILTRDNANTILETLRMATTFMPVNRLIIADASNDGTLRIVRKYAEAKKVEVLIENEAVGCGYARQRVLEKVETPIFAFLDTETFIHPNWFAKLKPHMNNEKVAVASGVLLHSFPLLRRYDERQFIVRKKPRSTLSNSLVKTEVAKHIGGFNIHFEAGEDADFQRRILEAGYEWVIDRNVKTWVYRSLLEWFKKQSYWNVGAKKQEQNVLRYSSNLLFKGIEDGARLSVTLHPSFALIYPLKQLLGLKGFLNGVKKDERSETD